MIALRDAINEFLTPPRGLPRRVFRRVGDWRGVVFVWSPVDRAYVDPSRRCFALPHAVREGWMEDWTVAPPEQMELELRAS